jgi:hypothetical protein
LIIVLPEQHYRNLDHIRQLCLHVGPMPVEAVPFGLGWVWLATPPHSIKVSRTFCKALTPPSRNLLSLYQELGPSRHFPLAAEARSPQQLQSNNISLCDPLCSQATTPFASTFHVDADGLLACPTRASIKEVMLAQTLAVPGAGHSMDTAVPECCPDTAAPSNCHIS